jgi:hypothetical protein
MHPMTTCTAAAAIFAIPQTRNSQNAVTCRANLQTNSLTTQCRNGVSEANGKKNFVMLILRKKCAKYPMCAIHRSKLCLTWWSKRVEQMLSQTITIRLKEKEMREHMVNQRY